MRSISIIPGATSQSVYLEIFKDNGQANTSLAYNTSGVAFSYVRDTGAAVSITLATLASPTAAYSSGGFVHVSNGMYRLDLPSAMLASGASVAILIGAEATDIRPEKLRVDLVGVNLTSIAGASSWVDQFRTLLGGFSYDTTGSHAAAGLAGMGVDYYTDNKLSASVASGDGVDSATLLARLTSTRAGNLDNLDAAVSGVKAKTDNLPTTPASQGDVNGARDTITAAIASNSDVR